MTRDPHLRTALLFITSMIVLVIVLLKMKLGTAL